MEQLREAGLGFFVGGREALLKSFLVSSIFEFITPCLREQFVIFWKIIICFFRRDLDEKIDSTLVHLPYEYGSMEPGRLKSRVSKHSTETFSRLETIREFIRNPEVVCEHVNNGVPRNVRFETLSKLFAISLLCFGGRLGESIRFRSLNEGGGVQTLLLCILEFCG